MTASALPYELSVVGSRFGYLSADFRPLPFFVALLATIFAMPAVAETSQTINFPPFEQTEYGYRTVRLGAIASSGLPVRYKSLTPDTCVLTQPFEGFTFEIPVYAALHTEGTCTIAANQDGDTTTSAALTVTRSVKVKKSAEWLNACIRGRYYVSCIGPEFVVRLYNPADQTLVFQPFIFSPELSNTPRFDLNASVVADRSTPPRLESLTPSICSVGFYLYAFTNPPKSTFAYIDVKGTPGVCTVRASAVNGSAEPVEVSFPVVNVLTKIQSTQYQALISTRLGLSADVSSAVPIPASATVRFVEGGAPGSPTSSQVLCTSQVVNNRAVCELPPAAFANAPGQRTYTAIYDDDTRTARNQSSLTQTFKRVTLSVSPQLAATGTPLRLLAHVAPGGTGTVSFTKDRLPIPGCAAVPVIAGATLRTASCATTVTSFAHPFSASYAGDTADAGMNAIATVAADRTGHWWAGESENGWGLVINQHGENPFVTFYVYDAEGQPDWFVISGRWDGSKNSFAGDLYRASGSLFSQYEPAKFNAGASIGKGSLLFTNVLGQEYVEFNYTIAGQTATKYVRKLPISGPPGGPSDDLTDIWWNPTENGWGVALTHQNNAIFAVWFTYDANGKPTWYPMPGGTWNGNTYTGTLYRTTSSPWLGVPYDPTKFKATVAGTMSFRFLDANTADMTYTVEGVTQTKTITRQPY